MIRTHASLFSGIGGAEIAASWMGWSNVFHCEIQEFPRRVLEYWYPNSKSYEDITKTDFTPWRGKIDVLTAGFPCQPFSLAGQRRGADDDRYLWPEALRAIREVQPSWFVGENVAALVTMVQPGEDVALGRTDDIFEENYIYRKEQRFTLDEICEGLEREGYAVQPFVIPACAVGAPHRRDRIWIVARLAADTLRTGRQKYHAASEPVKTQLADRQSDTEKSAPHPDGDGHTPRKACSGAEGCRRRDIPKPGERRDETERSDRFPGLSRDATYTQRIRRYESELYDGKSEKAQQEECREQQFVGTACPQGWWRDFPTQSPVCSRHDGVSLGLAGITFPRWRAEAVKALGNAWVPQVAYEIFRAIEKVENNEDADI